MDIVRVHFTFSADQIATAYRDGYALTAMSVGLSAPDQKLTMFAKIFNPKITREFAE